MSEQNSMQIMEKYLKNLIMDKYPGVPVTKDSDGLTFDKMKQILSKNYEELPDDVKPVAERLMFNSELAKKYECELDWFYTTDDAKMYLTDEESFKGSFALFLMEKHSAQYLFRIIDKDNLIVKDVHKKNGSVHLVCDRKYRDVSGYCPKKPILNREIIPVRAVYPDIFMKVVQRLIEQNT